MNLLLITNIDLESEITQIIIDTRNYNENYIIKLFNLLNRSNITIDFVTSTTDIIIFTLKNSVTDSAIKIMKVNGYIPEIKNNCTKITINGTAEITDLPGIVSKVINALFDKDIQILQFADNHNTMWVLIEDKNKEDAYQAIYNAFH
ncbi:ACT domain-containing protein [Gottfriedia acidiceleris]|uniref:ACT domain-containing protein n=1 Tax=Gottfriedia acidiceleris TaxID=371036 RepID=UPI000B44815D|nr:ACT domain-containing protein [Gottfriedia acidiceleris]